MTFFSGCIVLEKDVEFSFPEKGCFACCLSFTGDSVKRLDWKVLMDLYTLFFTVQRGNGGAPPRAELGAEGLLSFS